jgi:hypothetical protein
MENKKFCVALLVADDGLSSGIFQNECTVEELEELKLSSYKGDILLIGWMPYEYYRGVGVRENDVNFVHYDGE